MYHKMKKPKELDLFASTDFEDVEKGSDNMTTKEEPLQAIPKDMTTLFHRLSQSKFRSSFYLNKKDRDIISDKGLATIREHAQQIIAKRLAPAIIPNDGRQTPMRHGTSPVFIAQHATGCCCRGCLEKWHHIPKGKALTDSEQNYIVDVIMQWIEKKIETGGSVKK